MLRKDQRRASTVVLPLLVFLIYSVRGGYSQTFSSGSTGADGALNLTTPGVVLFDPKTFNPPLNPGGDNIFNFTNINIASGVTLRLTGKILNGPIFFLAAGAVQVDGIIDLSGENGHQAGTNLGDRIPSAPGPGGYGGGVGGGGNFPPQPGNGPGGGAPGIACRDGVACGGKFTGSQFLIPLIGGSGGGGETAVFGCGLPLGGGGGAGGGALLIASSVSITINGTINADGGTPGCDGGNGSGGAIRLMAPVIAGNGLITARGHQPFGGPNSEDSTDGRVRLEAFQPNFVGTFNSTPLSKSQPFNIVLPTTPPSSIRVTSIAGIPIIANPFSFPDAVINSSSPVSITIEAHYVPPGAVPNIVILSENVGDQMITAPALQGTLQLSTSTINVTLPAGGSRGYVRATW